MPSGVPTYQRIDSTGRVTNHFDGGLELEAATLTSELDEVAEANSVQWLSKLGLLVSKISGFSINTTNYNKLYAGTVNQAASLTLRSGLLSRRISVRLDALSGGGIPQSRTILDSDGNSDFAPTRTESAFLVGREALLNVSPSLETRIMFDTKTFDVGNHYSTATGHFTAPVAGFYRFSSFILMGQINVDQARFIVELYRNNQPYMTLGRGYSSGAQPDQGWGGSALASALVGDLFSITLRQDTGFVRGVQAGTRYTSFSGELVGRQ